MTAEDREYVFDPVAEGEDSPLAAVIEVTSRKWTRSIIERLLDRGPMRFSELRADIDGISDKVLSDSLEDLEELELVRREVKAEKPVEVEYSLTEAGQALESVIDAVADWTEVYLAQVESTEHQ